MPANFQYIVVCNYIWHTGSFTRYFLDAIDTLPPLTLISSFFFFFFTLRVPRKLISIRMYETRCFRELFTNLKLFYNQFFFFFLHQVVEIHNEPLSTGPAEEPTTVAIPLNAQSPVTDRDAEQKPLMINDPNNNGIPERDRNASQTKSNVCEECGKTFVTKASLKVYYMHIRGRMSPYVFKCYF